MSRVRLVQGRCVKCLQRQVAAIDRELDQLQAQIRRARANMRRSAIYTDRWRHWALEQFDLSDLFDDLLLYRNQLETGTLD